MLKEKKEGEALGKKDSAWSFRDLPCGWQIGHSPKEHCHLEERTQGLVKASEQLKRQLYGERPLTSSFPSSALKTPVFK